MFVFFFFTEVEGQFANILPSLLRRAQFACFFFFTEVEAQFANILPSLLRRAHFAGSFFFTEVGPICQYFSFLHVYHVNVFLRYRDGRAKFACFSFFTEGAPFERCSSLQRRGGRNFRVFFFTAVESH